MSKIDEARRILSDLQVPSKQQADLCCYTLLAMANLKETDSWANATNAWIRIHDVISYTKEFYGVSYAENSRETFRKQAIADMPDHMIHLNGDKFLGPRNS